MTDSESGASEIKSIRVSSTRTVLNVVYYEIETVFTSGRRVVVLSRFREFDDLNKRIRADYKLKYKHLYDNLPEFPAKSAFGLLEKQNETFINQRKEQLQTYLQKLAKLPHALENKDFVDFINRSTNGSDTVSTENTQNETKAPAPDFATTNSTSSSSSASASSTTSSSSATVSVGATTSSSGTVFLSRGFSAGTHPTTSTKSAAARPAAPKTAPPQSTPAAKVESKEEEKPAAPVSPTAKDSTNYTAADAGKSPTNDSSRFAAIGSSLKNSFGSLFGKKGAKPDVNDTVKNENL